MDEIVPKKRGQKQKHPDIAQSKSLKTISTGKTLAPDHITLSLFAPGMSVLHRVGLGGLACTLKAMERQFKNGLLPTNKLPAPYHDDLPPWTIDEQSVTLRFGRPRNAGEYLRRLFAFAFQIRDGLIYLPGQYPDPPPALAVRAEMQTALTRTFLQGAKRNVGLDAASTYFVDPDGSGIGAIEIQFQKCNWYLHQQVWKTLVDDDSELILNSPRKKIDGTKNVNFGSLYPGAIKRHDVLKESEASESVSGMLCCLFFLVGCACSRLSNSGDGILLLPDVQNLDDFAFDRQQMTPRVVSDVRVGGTADAAFQAEVRLRTQSVLLASSIPSCRAQRFSLRTWTKPQKSRVDVVEVRTDDVFRVEPESLSRTERSFVQFERALAVLPRGVRVRSDGSTYWTDSTIRPFIAENLAAGNHWFRHFVRIANTKEKRKKLSYERKGLNDMINDNNMWDHTGEKVVIRAVHSALRFLRGRIADIYRDRPDLMFKKFDDEQEKWGRTFASNMTLDQFRKSLAEMFRRAGTNSELQENWEHLLPMLRRETWQQARDLALIGLCSYEGRAISDS